MRLLLFFVLQKKIEKILKKLLQNPLTKHTMCVIIYTSKGERITQTTAERERK
nr:MAG TPA: hypothetical protein [Caudoviricetes sp.]